MQVKKIKPIFELFTKQNIEFKFVLFLLDQTLVLHLPKKPIEGRSILSDTVSNLNQKVFSDILHELTFRNVAIDF